MLCERCEEINRRILATWGHATAKPSCELVSLLMCVRCGAPLPEPGSSHRLLRKLGELARFGLAEDADVLLDR